MFLSVSAKVFGQFLLTETLGKRWLMHLSLIGQETLSWLLIGQFSLSIATSGMFSRSGNSPESIFSPELTILTNISHWVTRPGAGRGRRRQPYILFENFKYTINRRPCRQLAKGDKHYLYHLLLSAEKTSLFHNKVSWDTKTLFNTTY